MVEKFYKIKSSIEIPGGLRYNISVQQKGHFNEYDRKFKQCEKKAGPHNKEGKQLGLNKAGGISAIRLYSSKQEAVKNARKFIKEGYDLVIHKKDGSVQKWEESEAIS